VLALESAAVITTKFIMLAACGVPTDAKARTKGLPLTVTLPVWFQGVMASMIVMART
jgi:hypothetical protein